MRAIDAREAKIAAELADAAAKKTEAERERDDFKKKNEELDGARADIVTEANNAAAKERDRLIVAARAEATALKAELQEKRANDFKAQNQAVIEGVQREVVGIVRKTLTDLAQSTLEDRICEVFIDRLKTMKAEDKATFTVSLSVDPKSSTITSAFHLTSAQCAKLEAALNETFGKKIVPAYNEDIELVAGIELTAKGVKLAWSIAGYLNSFETHLNAVLSEGVAPTLAHEASTQ